MAEESNLLRVSLHLLQLTLAQRLKRRAAIFCPGLSFCPSPVLQCSFSQMLLLHPQKGGHQGGRIIVQDLIAGAAHVAAGRSQDCASYSVLPLDSGKWCQLAFPAFCLQLVSSLLSTGLP